MVSFESLALKCFLIIFCYLSVLIEACVIRKVCRVDDSCCHPLSEGSLDIVPGIDISCTSLSRSSYQENSWG